MTKDRASQVRDKICIVSYLEDFWKLGYLLRMRLIWFLADFSIKLCTVCSVHYLFSSAGVDSFLWYFSLGMSRWVGNCYSSWILITSLCVVNTLKNLCLFLVVGGYFCPQTLAQAWRVLDLDWRAMFFHLFTAFLWITIALVIWGLQC